MNRRQPVAAAGSFAWRHCLYNWRQAKKETRVRKDPKKPVESRRAEPAERKGASGDKRFLGAKVTTREDRLNDTYRVRRLPEPPSP
jgi:hypothetical protein